MSDQSAYTVKRSEIPVDVHGLVLRVPRVEIVKALYYKVIAEGHTLITGTMLVERPRNHVGKFLPGWRASCRAIEHGQRWGLGTERSLVDPDTNQVLYQMTFDRLDDDGSTKI